MQFRQPSSLSRLVHQLVDQVARGEVISLTFGSEAEARHLLTMLHEIATERQVSVFATSTGARSIELCLAAEAA